MKQDGHCHVINSARLVYTEQCYKYMVTDGRMKNGDTHKLLIVPLMCWIHTVNSAHNFNFFHPHTLGLHVGMVDLIWGRKWSYVTNGHKKRGLYICYYYR